MADTKDSRDKQAQDQDRRQRRRALDEALERADETEPSAIPSRLDEALERADETEPSAIPSRLDEALEGHDYPTTAERLLEAYGSYEVETAAGSESIAEVFAPVEADGPFDSADEVREVLLRLISQA